MSFLKNLLCFLPGLKFFSVFLTDFLLGRKLLLTVFLPVFLDFLPKRPRPFFGILPSFPPSFKPVSEVRHTH